MKLAFPTIGTAKVAPYLVETVIHRVVKIDGKLEMSKDAFIFGISSVPEWVALIGEIFTKSKQIAAYFNVQNKFKVVGEGRNMLLQFGSGQGSSA